MNGQLRDGVERRTRLRIDARKGTRVLLIEDSSTALSILTNMFATAGYDVSQSKESERGLSMACGALPDLVVLNVGLPGMNGFEVLNRIRKDPAARRIPVILISGNPRAIDRFRSKHIDADAFIKKPFTRFEIFSHVELMLNQDRVPTRANDIWKTPEQSLLRRIRMRLRLLRRA